MTQADQANNSQSTLITNDVVQTRTLAIIAESIGVETSIVKLERTLDSDLGVDSVDLVYIAMALEDEFSIEIRDLDAEKWNTIEDIVLYVKRSVGASNEPSC